PGGRVVPVEMSTLVESVKQEPPTMHLRRRNPLPLGRGGRQWVTRKIVELAQKYAEGRVVSTLEGGYDLQALAECAREHIKALIKGR
ncbi:MAG: hypothetical protein DRQ88_08915, partial [Epsilonproteobacteria bacterium]